MEKNNRLDMIAQLGIMVLGAVAIFLVSINNRYGFVCGLASQPFWYITAWKNRQWGILGVSVPYTISWCIGVYNHFF